MSSDLNQPTFEHLSSQNSPDTAKRYIKNYHGTVWQQLSASVKTARVKLTLHRNSNNCFCLKSTQFPVSIVFFAKNLTHVSNLVCKHVILTKRNALQQFYEFLLTLTRTKLNLPLQDSAYRFNISVPTAHRIFDRWIMRRKYIILQSTLPIDLVKAKSGESLSPIDEIARVSWALTNLSESVVPFN